MDKRKLCYTVEDPRWSRTGRSVFRELLSSSEKAWPTLPEMPGVAGD